MEFRYIDAHCHLQFEQYDQDREALIEKMREEGVGAIVVGTDLESSRSAIALAEKHEHLWATVGIHPRRESSVASEIGHDMSDIRALAVHPEVVAIGECGLDFFREEGEAERQAQRELFKQQVMLAAELDKPLIIHARPSSAKATEGKPTYDAYHDVIEILKEAKIEHPNLRGVAHFFAGGLTEAEAFIALDFSLSFTAVITFARDYDAVIRATPLGHLLAETDAPYVAPASHRGQRNDPLAVTEVVSQIASIRGDDPEAVRRALLGNTRKSFGLQAA